MSTSSWVRFVSSVVAVGLCACEAPSAVEGPKEVAQTIADAPEAKPYMLAPVKRGGWAEEVEGVDVEALSKVVIATIEGAFSQSYLEWAELTGEAPAELVFTASFDDTSSRMWVFDVTTPESPREMAGPIVLDRHEPWSQKFGLPSGPWPMAADVDGDGSSELVLAGVEGGKTTLRVFGMKGAALEQRIDVEIGGHVHVPFDHDGDGDLELVALTTSNLEAPRDASVEIEAGVFDLTTGKELTEVPLETWLPRFFTNALASEDLPSSWLAIRWSTLLMKAKRMTPFEPDTARDAALAGIARGTKSIFDITDPEGYARSLYWLEDHEWADLLTTYDGLQGTSTRNLLLSAMLEPGVPKSTREVAFYAMKSSALSKEWGSLDAVKRLTAEERGVVCDALAKRLLDDSLSDIDRGIFATRGARVFDCAEIVVKTLEMPVMYTPEDLKVALVVFNPKPTNRTTPEFSAEQTERATAAIIALLGHAEADVRATAALVLAWREGGEAALAAAAKKEKDSDTREMMKDALARKRRK